MSAARYLVLTRLRAMACVSKGKSCSACAWIKVAVSCCVPETYVAESTRVAGIHDGVP